MRQKTVSFVFDKIMWYLLYFLPILVMLISSINGTPMDVAGTMLQLGITPSNTNIIYTSLVSIFGTGGVLELFSNTGIFLYLTYFISCYLCHFILDLTIFMIKLCRKWIDSIVGGIE